MGPANLAATAQLVIWRPESALLVNWGSKSSTGPASHVLRLLTRWEGQLSANPARGALPAVLPVANVPLAWKGTAWKGLNAVPAKRMPFLWEEPHPAKLATLLVTSAFNLQANACIASRTSSPTVPLVLPALRAG